MLENQKYKVVIIGAGASGTALLYTLAHYTNLSSVALIEKYDTVAQVNSKATNNSQTLHVGDLETNYSTEKVAQVKPAAMMIKYFTDTLPEDVKNEIIFPTQKMVLGVGHKEVGRLKERYEKIKSYFAGLRYIEGQEIAAYEPAVMAGRKANEPVAALYNEKGYAVNFAKLASAFVKQSKDSSKKTIDTFFNRTVTAIKKTSTGYTVETQAGNLDAEVVVVDADAYSLGFAKALGYGKEFSLIPIAGTFYFTKKLLNGKVYTMQEPRLPFAAVHGDPDVIVPNATRFGPTARFFPVLESRKPASALAYFKSAGLGRFSTWKSFVVILLEPVRFWYLLKNLTFDIPVLGQYLFAKTVRKIIPSLKSKDLRLAKGFGGMRLQRVDVTKNELQLGEGKIVGDNIIFNMTPSPGASVCLYNGMRDAEQVMQFFKGQYQFDKNKMASDFMPEGNGKETPDVSLKHSYSS